MLDQLIRIADYRCEPEMHRTKNCLPMYANVRTEWEHKVSYSVIKVASQYLRSARKAFEVGYAALSELIKKTNLGQKMKFIAGAQKTKREGERNAASPTPWVYKQTASGARISRSTGSSTSARRYADYYTNFYGARRN